MDATLSIALCLVVPPLVAALAVRGAARVEEIRERRRHRRAVDGLGAAVSEENIAGIAPRSVVALEGKMMVEAPIVSFHPFGTSFFDEANVYAVTELPSGAIVVELDGGTRAMLEGAAQIVVGSVESEHRAPLERANALGAETLAAAKVRARIGQFRIARGGDRVRVRGVVELAPDDDALYRARSRAFRVSPESSDTPGTPAAIPICVTSKVVRGRVSASRPALALLAVAFAVGAGAAATQLVRHAPAAVVIVSPTPSPTTPPPCRKEVLSLIEHDAEEALRASTSCHDDWATAHVHFANGELGEASRSFKLASESDPMLAPSLTEAEAHLFAHDYASATATAERMVQHFYPGPSTAEKRDLECIVALLRTRAVNGIGGPLEHGSNGKSYRRICSTRPLVKFARDLDSEGGFGGGDGDDWRDWINGVYRPEAAFDPVREPRTVAFGTRARLLARPVGIERRVLDRLRAAELLESRSWADGDYGRFAAFEHPSDYLVQTTSFAAELTLFYAFSGFPERARAYWPILDRVAEVAASGRVFHQGPAPAFTSEQKALEDEHALTEWEMSIAAAAALFAGDLVRMQRYASVGEPHSRTAIVQLAGMLRPGATWEEPVEDGHWPPHSALFAVAQTGDGERLVAELVTQQETGRAVLARILPAIKLHTEALASWFRSSRYPAACTTCGASSYHGHLSDRREVARLLGERGTYERLKPAAEHFTDALTDVEVAFDLDELETFFHRNH